MVLQPHIGLTENGGGIMLYISEDETSKSLTEIKLDNEIENTFIEINLR